ncbi:MAG: hypothetical protein ACK5W1_01765 [Flavobacteriales bacterium]
MIDYTKIEIHPECGPRLLVHPLLSFRQPVDVDTGEHEQTDRREAVYGCMTFTSYPSGRITLRGSWHKYHHNGTNWQDFTLHEFREAVREFCETFRLDPTRMQLLQLEAGCNITPPLPTRETLRAFVSNGKGDTFSRMKPGANGSLGFTLTVGREFHKQKYYRYYEIKCYDKGAQYGRPQPLMRFEKKYLDWSKFRYKLGINSLADLTEERAWSLLSDEVSGALKGLILREPSVEHKKLPHPERLFFADAGRAGYWRDAPRRERYNARERLRRIVREYGKSDLHEVLRARIDEKLRELMNPYYEDAVQDVFHNIPESPSNRELGRFPSLVKVGERPNTLTTVEEDERATKPDEFTERKCRTCGRDISNQRPGSVFCSERLHGRAAKRCRNADSNPRNNDLRKLQRIEGDPLLFDHSPFLRAISNGIKTECAGHK